MTFPDKNEYIKYRISSAWKTFEAAKVLAENGYWNSAVNRLYYSVFYAVNALLVLNNISTKSHASTRSQFSLHFIKNGTFDKKFGILLSKLYDWRQKGDYENIFDYDSETVFPLIEETKEMINILESEIQRNLTK